MSDNGANRLLSVDDLRISVCGNEIIPTEHTSINIPRNKVVLEVWQLFVDYGGAFDFIGEVSEGFFSTYNGAKKRLDAIAELEGLKLSYRIQRYEVKE